MLNLHYTSNSIIVEEHRIHLCKGQHRWELNIFRLRVIGRIVPLGRSRAGFLKNMNIILVLSILSNQELIKTVKTMIYLQCRSFKTFSLNMYNTKIKQWKPLTTNCLRIKKSLSTTRSSQSKHPSKQ